MWKDLTLVGCQRGGLGAALDSMLTLTLSFPPAPRITTASPQQECAVATTSRDSQQHLTDALQIIKRINKSWHTHPVENEAAEERANAKSTLQGEFHGQHYLCVSSFT